MFRFSRLLTPPVPALLLLAGLTLIASSPLWSVDWFISHENLAPIDRVIAYAAEVRHGDFYPRWLSLTYHGKGSPFANFYSPAFYLLVAWLHAAGLPLLISLKALSTLLFFAGAWGMYLWTRPHFGNLGGLVAAIVYLFTPYHFVDIYVRGAFAEFAALAVLPYLFWAIDRATKADGNLRAAVLLGVSSALLPLVHILSAVMIFPFALLYAIYGLLQSGVTRSTLLSVGLGPVIGSGLSAFYWLPIILEKKYLNKFSDVLISGYFSYEKHFVYPAQLFSTTWGFGRSNIGPDDGMSFQIGLLLGGCILLSLILLYKLSKTQRAFVVINLAFGCLALLLTTSIVSFLYRSVPYLSFVQFPWRFLGPATLFLAAACGAFGAAFQANRFYYVPGIVLVVAALWVSSEQRAVKPIPLAPFEKFDAAMISSFASDIGSLCAANEYLPASATDRVINIKSDGKPFSPAGEFSRLETDGKRMRFTFTSYKPNNLIIIPWLYFPGWAVTIDGRSVPAGPSPDGFVSFSAPQGEHDVSIAYGTTAPRILGWLISCITVIGSLWCINPKRRASKVNQAD